MTLVDRSSAPVNCKSQPLLYSNHDSLSPCTQTWRQAFHPPPQKQMLKDNDLGETQFLYLIFCADKFSSGTKSTSTVNYGSQSSERWTFLDLQVICSLGFIVIKAKHGHAIGWNRHWAFLHFWPVENLYHCEMCYLHFLLCHILPFSCTVSSHCSTLDFLPRWSL